MVKELQAVGRWVYWNCGADGAAGVYDRTAKTRLTVPSGRVLAGDGYLVRHDRTAGKLMLTDFHTGTAETREIADLPAGDTADQRRLTWAVDRFGGDIAYADAAHAIHIVPSGVPAQPLADSEVDDDYVDLKDTTGNQAWLSTWQLSKPANWTLTLKDPTGVTERTLSGGPTAFIDAPWDGRATTGSYAYNGKHTWELTATAVEGGGTYRATGSINLVGGLPGFHDLGAASYGDLVTLNSSGTLTTHYGSGNGTFGVKSSGSGWPAGTVAVPFGDMGSDRCAELLVRMPGGELRRYTGKCGGGYQPAGSHTSLGAGWGL